MAALLGGTAAGAAAPLNNSQSDIATIAATLANQCDSQSDIATIAATLANQSDIDRWLYQLPGTTQMMALRLGPTTRPPWRT